VATAEVTSKFVASFLYGMKPNDPLAFLAAVRFCPLPPSWAVTLPLGDHLESILWSRYDTSDLYRVSDLHRWPRCQALKSLEKSVARNRPSLVAKHLPMKLHSGRTAD
jgi:hypothetical protein